jgi:hypothetical protein
MSHSWKQDNNGIYRNEKDVVVSYPETANDAFFSFEDDSPWFNQRNDLIIEILNRNNLSGNFLDIGGGNGFQAKVLSESTIVKNVHLVEPGYNGCLNAKKRGINNVYCGIFQDFDFEQNQIDICGLFDVIEHIEDDLSFLKDLFNCMKYSSHVVINVPAFQFLWSDTDINSGHFRRYTHNDLERIKKSTGFEVVDSGYYFSYYVIPLFLLRVIPYKLGRRKNLEQMIATETQNHQPKKGFIQGLIDRRHKFWINKVKSGKSPKIGTSMFIVLKKP